MVEKCERCGGMYKNLGAHGRFCTAKPLEKREGVPKTTNLNERSNVDAPVMMRERTFAEVIDMGIIPGLKTDTPLIPDRSIKVADDLTLHVKTITLPYEPAIIEEHVDDLTAILSVICETLGTSLDAVKIKAEIKRYEIESDRLAKQNDPEYLSLDQYTTLCEGEEKIEQLPEPISVVADTHLEYTIAEMCAQVRNFPAPVIVESEIKEIPPTPQIVVDRPKKKIPKPIRYFVLILIFILILLVVKVILNNL